MSGQRAGVDGPREPGEAREPGERALPCGGCGLIVAGGTEGCQRLFEELGTRDYLDVRYGPEHRLVVDLYALQHAERYGVSAKSLMAHLTGLCAALEHPGHRTLLRVLQQALNGDPGLSKSDLPVSAGS